MKTKTPHPIQLPEFAELQAFGGRWVEHAVSITLVTILLFTVATVLVSRHFKVESAVEASGVLEPLPTTAPQPPQWKVVLRVPEREINRIQLGAPVKILVPAALVGGRWDGTSLPARVTAIGSELAAGSALGRGIYEVEAALDNQQISPEQRALFRRGMTAEAHVIIRSALASDLILLHFRQEFDLDG